MDHTGSQHGDHRHLQGLIAPDGHQIRGNWLLWLLRTSRECVRAVLQSFESVADEGLEAVQGDAGEVLGVEELGGGAVRCGPFRQRGLAEALDPSPTQAGSRPA